MGGIPIGPLMAILSSNQDLQKEINALEAQMSGLDPRSPEYLYDQLNLEREKEMQRIREENPNLDPLNSADAKKLEELLAQDPEYQKLNEQISDISKAFPHSCSSWGIPFYFTKVVPAE